METSPSFCGNGYGYQTVHNNGYLCAEAAAAYAHGAGGFCYWLWRQQRSGIEQTHGSILNSWGMRSVGFNNVVKAGKLKDKLEKILAKTEPVKAEIAVSYSDLSRAFFLSEPMEAYTYNYVEVMTKWHNMILNSGFSSDFIFENNNLEGYKLLMTPFMPYVSEDYIEKALDFVEKGGIWIIGPVTGIRTCEHTINVDKALGRLEELAGVSTIYHYPMTGSKALGKAFGTEAPLCLWSSVFECTGAEPVGITDGGVTPGMPFITEYKKDKGKIIMLGSMPEGELGNEMLSKLLFNYVDNTGITQKPEVTKGTIAIPRKGNELSQWVIINMDGNGGDFSMFTEGRDVINGDNIAKNERIHIEAYGVSVIEY